MKKIIYSTLILFTGLILWSCSDYLSADVDDQLTFDKTFSQQKESEQFLARVYSFIPGDTWLDNMVGTSDESYFLWTSWGVKYLNHNNGSWNVTTSDFHLWNHFYRGINQATILIDNIDKNEEVTLQNRKIMKAEGRFLRAFFYFSLVRQYGPVYIWGDQLSDLGIKSDEVDRHSLEECVKFISDELQLAAADLPLRITDSQWYGRATKGAALALNARLSLYAARPLYNGADIYKGIKNLKGDFLFPQANNPQKWEAAAVAAKQVIDLNVYKLQTSNVGGDNFEKAINGYSDVLFKEWNDEIILGQWMNGQTIEQRSILYPIVSNAYGGFAPSLKLVDTYPMSSTGRYPIIGYQANGAPIIDQLSGYDESGFTNNYRNPADTVKSHTARVNNSVVNRDARFYASIIYSGMYWINTFHGDKLVTFHKGGTAYSNQHTDYNKPGYGFRRLLDPSIDYQNNQWGKYSWPLIRLAEMYLSYAEACNEKPNRNEAEALLYVNKVRNRAGLNNLEVAYPEIAGNKELLRSIIQKERMVELSFENHRYYDLRTWMIADKESNGPRYGRTIHASTYDGSWGRTSDQVLPLVFQPKHYLFPIHQNQLNEMKNMTQNYGW